jgi:hypothetical protein
MMKSSSSTSKQGGKNRWRSIMFNSLVATSTAQYGSDQLMQVRISAKMLFSEVMNRGKWIMFLQQLLGRQYKLQALAQAENGTKRIQKQSTKIVTVAIEKIVGSESRVHDFDKHFRPLVSHTRDRWAGIAIAHHQGIPLPPVELIQVGDEYYVRDGHHRISVAKTLGQATIEAQVLYKLA